MPVQEAQAVVETRLPAGDAAKRGHYRAYLSAATAEAIPYSDGLTEMAGADLLIISKEDAVNPDGTPRIPLPSQIETMAALGYDTSRPVKLRDIFNIEGIPDHWEMSMEQAAGLAHVVTSSRATSSSWDFDGDGTTDLGIITTDDLGKSPEDRIGGLAHLAEGTVPYAPGAAICYPAFMLAHEAAHVGQDPRTDPIYRHTPLPFEIDADQKAYDAIRGGLLGEGVDCREPMEALHDARLAASVVGPGSYATLAGAMIDYAFGRSSHMFSGAFPSHATHLATGPEGTVEGGLPTLTSADLQEFGAMMKVKTLVNGLVGGSKLLGFMQEVRDNGADIGPDSEAARYFNNPFDMLLAFENPVTVERLGAQHTLENPASALAALDVLKEKGYIPPGSLEEDYVHKVEAFYSDYAPEVWESDEFKASREKLEQLPMTEEMSSDAPVAPEPAPSAELAAPVTGMKLPGP